MQIRQFAETSVLLDPPQKDINLKNYIPQVGARLIHHVENWKSITNDSWVLGIVQEGLRLQFKSFPPGSGIKETKFMNAQNELFLSEEVKRLLEKNAIESVPKSHMGQGFYSTFFVVPKKDGGFRPILNIKRLNTYLDVPHFKMESLRSIISAIDINDWALSIDLTDAYLHVAVYRPHRRFLRLCFRGQHFQFRTMPFWLAIAPRIFTKLMSVVGSYLRKRQIQIFMYLDDWLLKNQNRQLLLQQLYEVQVVVQKLGLLVNFKKSQLVPVQIIQS